MATESSLVEGSGGPKGGELQLTTVKAKAVLIGAEYAGKDGHHRIMGLPVGLFARHFTGPKYHVDLVVCNVLRPNIPREIGVNKGVRGSFVFHDPAVAIRGYMSDEGRYVPAVVGVDAEVGLVFLANLILQRMVGVVRVPPKRGG